MVPWVGSMPKYKERVTLPFQIKCRVNYLFIWTECVLACREDYLAIGLGSEGFRALAQQWEGGRDGWLPRGGTGAVGLPGYLRAGC